MLKSRSDQKTWGFTIYSVVGCCLEKGEKLGPNLIDEEWKKQTLVRATAITTS